VKADVGAFGRRYPNHTRAQELDGTVLCGRECSIVDVQSVFVHAVERP
jgi:hypothetical protein